MWRSISGAVPRTPSIFGPEGIVVRIHEPPARPAAQQGLQFLTPKAHQFLNTSFVNMPRQRAAEGRATVHMNPADAALRGLHSDAEVRVYNDRGSLAALLRVSDDIYPGTVALPGKWWNHEAGNLLTPPRYSPGGQPAYNDTFVEVCLAEAVGASHTKSLLSIRCSAG